MKKSTLTLRERCARLTREVEAWQDRYFKLREENARLRAELCPLAHSESPLQRAFENHNDVVRGDEIACKAPTAEEIRRWLNEVRTRDHGA